MNRAIARALRLAALTLLAGCAVTDTGNPPLSPPDPDGLSSMFLAAGQVTLGGAPGTWEDGAGIVRITNLQTSDVSTDAPVAMDGSFSATVAAETGAVLRIQHIVGPDRSLPVDVIADSAQLAPTPVACLRLVPALELNAGSLEEPLEDAIRIENDCAEAVELTARGRTTSPSLSVAATPATLSVASGDAGELRLTIQPPAEDSEEVLLFDITGAETGTRAVTVRATGP